MTQRTTKKDVESQFNRLLYLFGKNKAESYKDVGAWYLDYIACYGGYVIQEVITDTGAITHPFDHTRRSAKEFIDWAFDITRSIEQYLKAQGVSEFYKCYLIDLNRQEDHCSTLLPPLRSQVAALYASKKQKLKGAKVDIVA